MDVCSVTMAARMRGRVARPIEVTVVTVGDSGVGKTALINRFCQDVFLPVSMMTAMVPYLALWNTHTHCRLA